MVEYKYVTPPRVTSYYPFSHLEVSHKTSLEARRCIILLGSGLRSAYKIFERLLGVNQERLARNRGGTFLASTELQASLASVSHPQHPPRPLQHQKRNVMSPRQLLRKPLLSSFFPLRNQPPRRFTSKPTAESQVGRIDRVLDRFPKFLHPYTKGLRNAPVTHVVSFLILHEITAVVPLVGLAGGFHWWGAVPDVSSVLSVVGLSMRWG